MFVLNVLVIFALSAQSADVSTEESDVLVAIPQQVYNLTHPENANSYDVYILIQLVIRKTAHFMEFATLSALGAGLLLTYAAPHPYVFGCLFSILYGASDEIHQLFVPGRDGKVADWLIDSFGAVLGVLVLWIVLSRLAKRRSV